MEILVSLLILFLSYVVGNILHINEQKKDIIKEDIKTDKRISSIISQMLVEPIDKISIFQLHNGQKFYGSKSHIKFVSKVFEKSQPGISSTLEISQNIPASIFLPILDKFYHNIEYVSFNNVEEIEDSNLKSWLVNRGVLSYHCFAIRTINGKLIGFITIAFIKDHHRLTKLQQDIFHQLADRLGGYLEEKN